MIHFDTARPSEELFPLDEFRATVREALEDASAGEILQLGSPYGYGPLRDYLLEKHASGDDLLITNGCQQALDLVQRSLTESGDTVLVEDPVYAGVKNVFLRAGVRLVGVPVLSGGLDLEALERLLAREKPRLLLLTPNFQNPTGLTMSRGAREAVLKLARSARALVVENDIYGELRYAGTPLPTLRDLDADVIQLKSFSKIAFPGLRVGWVLGPRPALARLAETKQWADLHSDQLAQAVLLRFARSGRLEAHLQRVREGGAVRLRALLEALDAARVDGLRWTRPEGGMNLWLRLPEPLDAEELLAAAQRENVTYLPGRWFAVSRVERGALRLCFAGLEPERIRAGIGTLVKLMRETRDRVPAPAIV
jgi:DNA-binding transcriptional MocR family regulator